MATAVRLTTFGALRLETFDGRPVEALGARRLTFLALIAAHGERGISRRLLTSLFWPESDELRARTALNQAVYVLRQTLGERSLILEGTGIALNAEVITSDIAEFARARGQSNYALMSAVYAGPFLDGVAPSGDELGRHVESIRQDIEMDSRDASRRVIEVPRSVPVEVAEHTPRPVAARRKRMMGTALLAGMTLAASAVWFTRNAAAEPEQFDTLGEQLMARMAEERAAELRAVGDTTRIGRIVILTPEYEERDAYFARLDAQMRFAVDRAFATIVPSATTQQLEHNARATRMPTSTSLQIQEILLKASAPLAIRTVVLPYGDSISVSVGFWRVYVPRALGAKLDPQRSPVVQMESWSPPAPRYARRDSLKALVATADLVRRAVSAMETCSAQPAELQSWCWKTPTQLIPSPNRRLRVATAAR